MSMIFGGSFNAPDPWLGLPIYVWEWILNLVIIGLTWYGLKKVWWDPYVKFHGLHYAKKNDSGCSLIIDATGDTEMVQEQIAKCIFDYSQDEHIVESDWADVPVIGWFVVRYHALIFWYPTKYLDNIDWKTALKYKIGKVNFDCKIAQTLQKGEWDQYPAVISGGIPVDIVIDTDHWAERKSRQHKAIVRSAREYNIKNPDDQVHTYTKYARYLSNCNIPWPDELKKDYLVTWQRIDAGYPLDLKNSDYAGKLRQMGKNRDRINSGENLNHYAYLMIGGVTVFGVVGIVAKLIALLIK